MRGKAASVVCVPSPNSGVHSPAAYTAMCASRRGACSASSTPRALSAASAAAICAGVNDGLGHGVKHSDSIFAEASAWQGGIFGQVLCPPRLLWPSKTRHSGSRRVTAITAAHDSHGPYAVTAAAAPPRTPAAPENRFA